MYIVTGATGHTGSVAAEALLADGKPVRAVVRDTARAGGLRERGAEVVAASLEDTAALTEALRGGSGVYLLLPPRPTAPDVVAEQSAVVASMADAVARSGVPHVVLLSSIGGHLSAGNGPIASLHEAEERLRATGAAVTAVRASYFMENWLPSLAAVAGGVLPSFLRADLEMPMVATRDIGRFVASTLAAGGRGFEAIELAGPRDYTPAEVAAAAGAIAGKPVALQVGPEEAIVPAFMSFGMSADMARLYREMIHGFNHGKIGRQSDREARGTIPIEDVLRPALTRSGQAAPTSTRG